MLGAAAKYTDHSRPGPSETEPTTPRVLIILAVVLERLVARNERLVDGLNGYSSSRSEVGKSLKAFQGVRAPNISIPKYLERIYKYTNCSPSCFVVGYVYIDRLLHRHPDSLVISLNVHRLLVTSVLVASKMLDDAHYNNAFYARVGGVSNAELNRLELELLFLLDFGVTVSSRVFESYCFHLEKETASMFNNGELAGGFKIEKPILIHNNTILDDQVTEISVEESQISSPPQTVE